LCNGLLAEIIVASLAVWE